MNKDQLHNKQDNNSVKDSLTDIDHFILKIIIAIFISLLSFLVVLIIFKIALKQKLIYKLSDYF